MNELTAKVTIIMPVYNSAEYLPETLAGIAAQSFSEWELIIVDDGSTDGSGEYCDLCAEHDKRIRVYHTENRGVDAARNTGMSYAKSEWITFLDSDDVPEPAMLETLYAHTNGADAVIGGYHEFPSGKRYQAYDRVRLIEKLNDSEDEYIRIDRSFVLSCLHAKLYRRQAIRHLFRLDKPYADDTFFNLDNLFEMNNIVFVPGYLYSYRRREDGAALHNGAKDERLKASYDLMKLVLAKFPGSERMHSYLTGKFVIRIFNDFVRRLETVSEEEQPAFIEKLMTEPLIKEAAGMNLKSPLPQLEEFLAGICSGDPGAVLSAIERTGKKHIRSDSPGLISVIIPAYNMEATVTDAINSIIEQSYTHWELLVADDGSTDNTGVIVDAFAQKDPRIHSLHQPNAGIGAARNTALQYAAGEWIAFLDADDLYLPDSFAQMIKASEGADLVACGTYVYHAHKVCSPYSEVKVFEGLPDGEDLDKLWANCVYPVVWAKLYRRSMIKEYFPTDLNYGEDTLFNLRVFRKLRRIVVIPQVGYHYIRRRERLDRGMLEGARRQLNEAAQLFQEDDVILRRIYIAFIRQVRRFALNVIDSDTMTPEEKEEELNFCTRVSRLPAALDHEEFLFPVNLKWWRQLKAGQYDEAVEGLRIILEERSKERDVLYQNGGSADQS